MRRRALVVLLVLGLAACGRKAPPVAPETRVPQPVTDLRGEVRDGAVQLSWTNPTRRADGSRLRDLSEARVYRTDDAGEADPKPALLARGRIVGYKELARISLGAPPASGPPPTGAPAVQGPEVRLADREGLAAGRRYSYVVVTEDASGRVSPPSPRVSVTFMQPPAPPAQLSAAAGQREVRLTWEPTTRLADGTPATGPFEYEVLRATARDAEGTVVALSPVAEFVDRGLENDRTYYYQVRALRRQGATIARGEASTRVAATPQSLTPPSPPTDLVATPAAEGVRLSWRASPDPGVAGYVVYRAGPQGTFERVGSTQAPVTVFVDRNVRSGTYRYGVTARDASVRPNESARSTEVTVTVP